MLNHLGMFRIYVRKSAQVTSEVPLCVFIIHLINDLLYQEP